MFTSLMFSSVQRSLIVGLLLISLLTPHVSIAATNNHQLLQLIQELTKQVTVLQQLLNEKRSTEAGAYQYGFGGVSSADRYKLNFFSITPEATYQIANGDIVPTYGTQERSIDVAIFSLLRETLGREAFTKQGISEFWIFNQDRSTLSGFVESRSDTGAWIVGINRDDFDVVSASDRAAYQELFIHEYAHILLLDEEELRDAFTNRFWTAADYRAGKQVEDAYAAKDSFTRVDALHERYADRFVSAYAMLNPDEDLAETFVAFIEESRPVRPTKLREEKIAFLYQYPFLVQERDRLRNLR